MDTKIRKLLTCNRIHHRKADVERLYVPRREGGRGLMQLEMSFKTTTLGLCKTEELQNALILWDFAIHTDTKIDANKPGITIKDHTITPVYWLS